MPHTGIKKLYKQCISEAISYFISIQFNSLMSMSNALYIFLQAQKEEKML